jgi:uncharacterized protein YegL
MSQMIPPIRNAWIQYSHSDAAAAPSDLGISTFSLKENESYGVLCIQTETEPITSRPILFHFQVDVSGSMSDKTSDGRTKMQLIVHTLTNMLYYFAEQCEKVYVQVTGFDDKLHPYIAPVQVTSANVEQLVAVFAKMRPQNFTDIGLALRQLSEDIGTNMHDIPRGRRVGILLTDGEPTVGISNPDDLAALVPTDISMSFIALGDDHSGEVMRAMGHVSPISSNWFVNQLEHTGNVYGEIIFNELHRLIEQTVLHVTNGRIYDYLSGDFVEQLSVGTLCSDSVKYYHILTDDPDNCVVRISGISNQTNEPYEVTASDLPPLIACTDANLPFPTDSPYFMQKHWYRMLVQLLMSNARRMPGVERIRPPTLQRMNTSVYTFHKNTKIDPTHEIDSFVQEAAGFRRDVGLVRVSLARFMNTQNLNGDAMLIGLRDDITILENTLGTPHFVKYAGVREDSQGRQSACNTVTDIPNDYPIQRAPVLSRAPTSAYATPSRLQVMTTFSQNDDDESSPGQSQAESA